MNVFIITGRLTADPTLKQINQTNGTTTVCNFTVAENDISNKNADGTPKTYFWDCSVFGKQAENLVKYQRKGAMVGVKGRMQRQQYTSKDGTSKIADRVFVESLDFLGGSTRTESTESEEATEVVSTKAPVTSAVAESRNAEKLEATEIPEPVVTTPVNTQASSIPTRKKYSI